MNTWEQIVDFFKDPIVSKISISIVGLLILVALIKLVQRIAMRPFKDSTAKYKARKSIGFLGYVIAFIFLLIVFKVQLTGVTVALGVAGAGIAFALQEVIVSIAGYIAIQSGNFYKIGDRVKLGSIRGDVIDIGVLRTTVMETGDWISGDLYNGRMVRIANSILFKEPVFNYSGEFPFLWDEISVPLKTISDFEYAEVLFQEILQEIVGDYAAHAQKTWDGMTNRYMLEKASVQPMVTLVFDENWITFTLRYVVDFQKRRSTKHIISKRVLQGIKASGGRLEVASAAMEITAFPKQNK